MSNILRPRKRSSIQLKLLLALVMFAIIPTLIITSLSVKQSTKIIYQRVYESLENNMTFIEDNLIEKINYMKDISSLIYRDPDLMNLRLNQQENNVDTAFEEMITIDNILLSYVSSEDTMTSVVPHFYVYNKPQYTSLDYSSRISDLGDIQSEPWYHELNFDSEFFVHGVRNDDQDIVSIRLNRQLYGVSTPKIPYLGLLTLDVAIDEFTSILSKLKLEENSNTYLIDYDYTVLSEYKTIEDELSLTKEDFKDIIEAKEGYSFYSYASKINEVKYLITFKKIEGVSWFLISFIPVKALFKDSFDLIQLSYIIVIGFGIFAITVGLIISRRIAYPIRKLVAAMDVVQNNNFDDRISYEGIDEFGYLIQSYNNMIGRIKDLIAQLFKSEDAKRVAEFNALQAQINPHFLYNTLDSVNWLALEIEAEDISTMVTSLSDFFRYSLNRGGSMIRLEEEMLQVESYLKIQKVRFKETLDYTMAISSMLYDVKCIKLIIQPLVENAIIHGIQPKGGGHIDVRIMEEEGFILIEVEDDGVGCDVEALNKSMNEAESRSIGIYNVLMRVTNVYGEASSFYYENSNVYESGVIAKIKFPIDLNEKV